MTPEALLALLDERSVRLTPSPDGRLRCTAPQGALTHALKARLRQRKVALVDLLEARAERTALGDDATPPSMAPTVHPAVELGIPLCGHDPIFFERQKSGHYTCLKCALFSVKGVSYAAENP